MTKAISLILAAILCALLFLCSVPQYASARPAPTYLYQTTYRGWHDAFRLTNGKVDVILVPTLGRIMAFQFAGQPQTNVLWNNPALLGKPLPFHAPYPPRATDWVNYGGDKLWPSPQSDWGVVQHQPGPWPPDPQMDYGPYQVSRLTNGLRLTGPLSVSRQIRAVRDFILAPGGTQLVLRETFQKPLSANFSDNTTQLPLGLWNIAQARPDATVFLPLNPNSRFAGGYVPLMGDRKVANWRVGDGILAVTAPAEQGDKAGVDAREGWIAALYAGHLLFSEQCALSSHGVYPDQNTSLQVYAQGGAQSYLELELLGTLREMKPGAQQTRTLIWTLRRLPRAPRSLAAARHLVKSLLSAHMP